MAYHQPESGFVLTLTHLLTPPSEGWWSLAVGEGSPEKTCGVVVFGDTGEKQGKQKITQERTVR